MRKGQQGLKALRRAKGNKPTYDCKNCSCKRYSPCTCRKKVKK